jgi:signal transduction histidine kinase
VALCRYRPRLAWAIELAAVTATALAGGPVSRDEPWPWAVGSILALVPVLAVLGARCSRSTAALAWLVLLVDGLALHYGYPGRGSFTGVAVLAVTSGAVLLLADAVRERARATAALAEQEEVSEAERARRGLLEERTRIARELHDVVAHHMSVIAVQADSAPYRLPGLAPDATAEFSSIADSARRSLTEMRRLLEVLRNEDTAVAREPQPGLDQLSQLVQNAGAAGITARLTVRAGAVPEGLALTAYRIVQEALSNVVRHAPGAMAEVLVERSGAVLRVEIRNGPGANSTAVERGGGLGLTGMRERVAVQHGTVRVGPTDDGGFAVRATLPVD